MTDWRPIESAPRDGERIIVAKIAESGGIFDIPRRSPHVWFAVTASWNGRYWTDGLERLVEPTHWIPLPPVQKPAGCGHTFFRANCEGCEGAL